MVQPESRTAANGNKIILELAERMSNYITLLSPPEKIQADLQSLSAERAKYDEIIANYNVTVQDLQQKTQQIKLLKAQNVELVTKLQGLEASLNSVSESQSVKDLCMQLQVNLNTETQKAHGLSNEINSLRASFEILSQKSEAFAQMDLELAKLQNKLSGEWKKNQNLRQTLLNEREMIKTLQAEKKGLEYALRRLERRLTAKGSLRGLSIPIHHLEVSEDLVGKADAEIQEQIRNMNLELRKRLDRIKEMEIRNKILKENLAKSSTHDLQLEMERLKSDLETKNGSIMGLESTRKKLTEQVESFQKRLGALQNKIMAQGKEIEEKNKSITELESAVSLGVHDQQARGVIQSLQKQNRDFRNQVRDSEKISRSLEKNIKYLQTQYKQQKEQAYKLYNQNHEQVVLIQKLQSALQRGGSAVDFDLPAFGTAKSLLSEEGPTLDDEIRERDRKITRLESYVESLKQEVEDFQFRMTSRDVKIDELNNILKEMKTDLASSKAKIIIRPPSTDEYRKTKVRL